MSTKLIRVDDETAKRLDSLMTMYDFLKSYDAAVRYLLTGSGA